MSAVAEVSRPDPSPQTATADATLLCVDPAMITEFWPHVSGLMARAFENTRADSTLESVEEALRCGKSLLWIVWRADRIVAAATTELWLTPARKACVITCCAGTELETWRGFMADFETYARNEGCEVIRIFGRPGWKRVFPEFREPWVTIEKALI